MDITYDELLHIICELDDYPLSHIGVDERLVDQIHDIASEANPNGKLEH